MEIASPDLERMLDVRLRERVAAVCQGMGHIFVLLDFRECRARAMKEKLKDPEEKEPPEIAWRASTSKTASPSLVL